MKILMVHPHDLYSENEPWTIRILNFARELVKKGHTVKIAYFPLCENKIYCDDGVEIIPLNRKISPASLMGNLLSLYKLAQWADVIHFQKCHFYSALPVLLVAYIRGKPLHYDWDDWEEQIFYISTRKYSPTTFFAGLSFQLLERYIPMFVDSVSVSSEALRVLALKRGGVMENIFDAPVGADLKMFSPRVSPERVIKDFDLKGSLLVLYHGQLHSCQYANLLIGAIKTVSNELSEQIRYMILGTGSRLNDSKEFARAMGVYDQIIFTGYIPHENIPQYIAAADICVASFEDNPITRCKSPLKVAEYLASGKAIVASDVGEIRSMVGEAGLLVSPGNSSELAAGIIKLCKNKSLRTIMAINARKIAERKYNWKYSADNLEKAYKYAQGIHCS
jgi:glycosyltransferase involved in cell wall biosynthesis